MHSFWADQSCILGLEPRRSPVDKLSRQNANYVTCGPSPQSWKAKVQVKIRACDQQCKNTPRGQAVRNKALNTKGLDLTHGVDITTSHPTSTGRAQMNARNCMHDPTVSNSKHVHAFKKTDHPRMRRSARDDDARCNTNTTTQRTLARALVARHT